jgi:hypothetical protein
VVQHSKPPPANSVHNPQLALLLPPSRKPPCATSAQHVMSEHQLSDSKVNSSASEALSVCQWVQNLPPRWLRRGQEESQGAGNERRLLLCRLLQAQYQTQPSIELGSNKHGPEAQAAGLVQPTCACKANTQTHTRHLHPDMTEVAGRCSGT